MRRRTLKDSLTVAGGRADPNGLPNGRGRTERAVAALLLLSVSPTVRQSAAQVGHEPGQSPYRDVRRGAVGVLTFGYLGGSRGSVGVGLADGNTGGIRYEALFGAIGASLGLAYGRTSRYVVDPFKDTLSRKSALLDNDVVLVDAGLQLVLTGRKTWRGFAPYVGGALGVAIGGRSPRDSSGYRFGTTFTIAPNAGLRWYLARRVSVRSDFRLVLWKLNYPISYKQPASDGSRVLPLTAALTDWTSHPWATIGVGWTF